MAYIDKLTKKQKTRRNVPHTRVKATYFFTDEGYLQIDTYGSDGRQDTGGVSQSMQFSPEIMKQMLAVILKKYKITD